jgi:Cys-tRNA(Pro)/Cys-tRNA(Cys) deacylase
MHLNIEALLRQSPYKYTVHEHARLATPIRTPQDFANALGYDLSRIAKTLFLKGYSPERYALAVCSVNRKVDLALLASALGSKHVQVARREDLQEKIGYPQYSVSPLGIKDFPIFLDKDLLNQETVLVGAGASGVEIEIAPADLLSLTKATVLSFSS